MTEKRNLTRALGLGYVIIIVISNMLGSGVFKKIAPMAAELHSSEWILLVWLAAGLITLFGALSNAEVAGLLADTGGEFVYLRTIYGRFFSFLYGWSLFTVIQTAAISGVAYVFTQSLNSIISIPDLLPSMHHLNIGGIFYPFQDFGIKLTTILLILFLTFLNMSGLKSGAWVNKAILLIVGAGLLLIVMAGLTGDQDSAAGNMATSQSPVRHTVTLSSFYTAMLAAFWAYQGWVSVGFIGGEVKHPHRNIPKGIIAGVAIVIIVYLVVNYTYLRLLSIPQLEEINNSGNQIAGIEAIRGLWGKGGVLFISLLIIISTLGCTNASILTGARPYYAMARQGLFFRGTGRLNNRNVPSASLLWQGIWASILVLSGTFDQLTDMLIFAVYIFYGATAMGVFILRRRMPDAHRPYKTWGYPIVPVIFVLFCVGLFFNTIITRPREAGIGLSLILLGIPVYFLLLRRGRNRDDSRGQTFQN
ncbi:MAG: amino acid permease [Bacteroidales bacterium]|jgi:APA family basic amino acid/polyamine antiporter|nr:amino acid permease [Bacteroidales bacterium]